VITAHLHSQQDFSTLAYHTTCVFTQNRYKYVMPLSTILSSCAASYLEGSDSNLGLGGRLFWLRISLVPPRKCQQFTSEQATNTALPILKTHNSGVTWKPHCYLPLVHRSRYTFLYVSEPAIIVLKLLGATIWNLVAHVTNNGICEPVPIWIHFLTQN
jgi:hypothetical protein